MDPRFASFLKRVPKVELHCHLVGALRAQTVIELGRRHGMSLPGKTAENLYTYADFYEFIEVYRFCGAALRQGADFERAAYEVVEDAHRFGHGKHIEIAVNPSDFLAAGVSYAVIADGLISGLKAARRDFGVSSFLIAAIDREKPVSVAMDMLREVIADKREEIAGIGMDYAEDKGAPELFAQPYALAGRAGMKRTAHVCEDYLTQAQAPPSNVTACMEMLGCDRLDHGYNMLFDEKVVAAVRERQIPLTCCVVTSDVRRREKRLQTLGRMVEAGLNVTLNTDDPQMFGTSLDHSWNMLFEAHHWGPEMARRFSLAGVDASWLPPQEKKALRDSFELELTALEREFVAD